MAENKAVGLHTHKEKHHRLGSNDPHNGSISPEDAGHRQIRMFSPSTECVSLPSECFLMSCYLGGGLDTDTTLCFVHFSEGKDSVDRQDPLFHYKCGHWCVFLICILDRSPPDHHQRMEADFRHN